MFSAIIGLAALVIFFLIVRSKKNGMFWTILLVISAMIVGTSPIIAGVLPGLFNWVINLISNAVFHESVATGTGAYSGAVVIICIILLVWFLWDGVIKSWERWAMICCCFVIGSTDLVTPWLAPILNSGGQSLMNLAGSA